MLRCLGKCWWDFQVKDSHFQRDFKKLSLSCWNYFWFRAPPRPVPRYYWLQPEKSYRHADVPAGLPSEAHGENQNHRDHRFWEAPCWPECNRGCDELQWIRHWGRSDPQQSLSWQRWWSSIISVHFSICISQLAFFLTFQRFSSKI